MTFVETTAAYSASASNAGLSVALPRTVVADPPWWPNLHKNTKGRTEGPYRAGLMAKVALDRRVMFHRSNG